MSAVPTNWTPRLASVIAAALQEYGLSALRGTPVVALDVGCFPWHGQIGLSVLTAGELDADPALADPREQASWTHFDFAADLTSWAAAEELCSRMREAYYAATGDETHGATAEAFMRACADAVASPQARAAIELLNRDPRFRISVAHPDTGREFWSPDA